MLRKKNKQTPKCRANEIHCQFYKLFLLMCWPNFEKGVFLSISYTFNILKNTIFITVKFNLDFNVVKTNTTGANKEDINYQIIVKLYERTINIGPHQII